MGNTTTNKIQLRGDYIKERNALLVESEPCVIHCHHYNTYLQAVIEDTSSYLDVYPLFVEASQAVVYDQMSIFFKSNPHLNLYQKKEIVTDYFTQSGFGSINFSATDEKGGIVIAKFDHYGIGWKLKFGLRMQNQPGVSFFTCGFIAGSLEAIYDLPMGSLECYQTKCIAKGDEFSEFNIKISKHKELKPSPQEGCYQFGQLTKSGQTTVDYHAIRNALISMPIEGNEKTGIIEAFGVMITTMYSNYYCLLSYSFLKLFEKEVGKENISIAKELLTEAGHVCAFNTFGGIMQSVEWEALIKPMIISKEDWVHGIIAVVNGLGWGFWEVETLVPNEKLVVKITSGYEANSYIKAYGASAYPISFLATGGVAGIMNLIYNTTITENPITLDNQLYKKIYTNRHFTARQIKCRAMGDQYDLIEAKY